MKQTYEFCVKQMQGCVPGGEILQNAFFMPPPMVHRLSTGCPPNGEGTLEARWRMGIVTVFSHAEYAELWEYFSLRILRILRETDAGFCVKQTYEFCVKQSQRAARSREILRNAFFMPPFNVRSMSVLSPFSNGGIAKYRQRHDELTLEARWRMGIVTVFSHAEYAELWEYFSLRILRILRETDMRILRERDTWFCVKRSNVFCQCH